MDSLELIEIFDKASNIFLNKQKDLIFSGVNERSWYPYLIMYLKEILIEKNICGYNSDSEYNKNLGKLKTVYDDVSLEVIPVVCDIIVHSRGKNLEQDNLICIEMKKSTARKESKNKDKRRLELLTKDSFDNVWSFDGKNLPEHVCRYKLGIYYEINIKKKQVYIEYYEKGKKFNDLIININDKN